LIILLVSTFAKADGFGEYSGFLIYNLSINSSQTEAWTLLNTYSYNITFYVLPPTFSGVNGSNVTPTLKFSALNGTIGGDSTYQINVTAYIPIGTPANATWQGYATAFANSAKQGNSTARIQIGTAKLIKIRTYPEPVKKTASTTSTTTTISPQPAASQQSPNNNSSNNSMEYFAIIAVLGAGLVGALAYILGSRNRGGNTTTSRKKN